MNLLGIVFVTLLVLALLVAISYAVEALRPAPPTPNELRWASDIPVDYRQVEGIRVRYIKTGNGPNLVLLHTLRTQLDIFERIVPPLSRHFTVYSFDYPGHGYSDIPETQYTPQQFVRWVSSFLETLDIKNATVAGISIGGSIALALAARRHPCVERVIAINPYDYAGGGGIARSSSVARVIFSLSRIPVIGPTVMRLRNRLVEQKIFEGGVSSPAALSPALREELFLTGTRKGHYRAFLNLLRHAGDWESLRNDYAKIGAPILLVYGDEDWSTAAERDADHRLIPGAELATVPGGGHFLSLDRPRELQALILQFAREK